MSEFKSRFLVGDCYVVHCKKAPYDVYIGRPGPWGNGFQLKLDFAITASMREQAIARYEAWVLTEPGLVEKIKRELRGRVLGCWCKPHFACHGDVLARIANEGANR